VGCDPVPLLRPLVAAFGLVCHGAGWNSLPLNLRRAIGEARSCRRLAQPWVCCRHSWENFVRPDKWLIVPATPQITATSSISTSASFGSPATCTVERAGAATGKYFAYTSFIAAKSFMSFRNTVVFTT
jgi:hypothetical protein